MCPSRLSAMRRTLDRFTRSFILRQVCIAVLGLVLLVPTWVSAQVNKIAVPNLAGLSVPEAARVVGEVGLLFEDVIAKPWSADSKAKANQVIGQDPAPGSQVVYGTPVSVTVLRAFSALLTYGDN